MNLAELGITNEDLIAKVVEKLAEEFCGDADLSDMIESEMVRYVRERVDTTMKATIDSRLEQEMSAILSSKIAPVNIWGEATGEPTTIREALAERAKEFWDVRVDEKGKPTTWNGKPRHQRLLEEILQDKFAQAVKQHAEEIVAGFRAAVKTDLSKLCAEHIEKLIPSRR